MLPHLGGTVELGVAPVAHKQVVVAVDPSRPQAVAAIIINLSRFYENFKNFCIDWLGPRHFFRLKF